MTPEQLTVAEVVTVTGMPVRDWVGDCFGISLAICDRGLVEGRPVHGYYLGPVHPACAVTPPTVEPDDPAERMAMVYAFNLTHAPYGIEKYEQGYIALADGRVMDPTRWTFEMVRPYIYVGPGTDYRPAGSRADVTVQAMMLELARGSRAPYSGLGLHPKTREALRHPWFRPLFDLASLSQ